MSSRRKFLCLDCGCDTGKIGEHYMLLDSVWDLVHDSRMGMLCISCLELRLGRQLTPQDFNSSYVNRTQFGFRSMKLALRMGLL